MKKICELTLINTIAIDFSTLQKLQRLETVWCGENFVFQGNDLGEDVNVVPDSVAEEGAWWK